MRFPAAAALALVFSGPLQAGVEVTATGDRLDVIAAQTPVSEVLDGLARKTRMKIVYEGPVPRTPVTVELRGRTPAQAVLGVLEGLGLNYALVLDVSGTEVETLMIVGTGGLTASATGAVRPARAAPRLPAHQDDPSVEPEEPTEAEAATPDVVHDAPKADDAKSVPAPLVVGPRNPTGAFPGSSPFAPGPLPLPSPSPKPPSSP